jgi:hypothetical protein
MECSASNFLAALLISFCKPVRRAGVGEDPAQTHVDSNLCLWNYSVINFGICLVPNSAQVVGLSLLGNCLMQIQL